MIILGYTLQWAAQVIHSFTTIYWWIVLIAVLLSWFRVDPWNPLVRFFRTMVDPPCWWIRRKMPFVLVGGMVDLSPVVLLLGLEFVDWVVVRSLLHYGMTFL